VVVTRYDCENESWVFIGTSFYFYRTSEEADSGGSDLLTVVIQVAKVIAPESLVRVSNSN